MILRMVPEIEISIAELGSEGRLLALQLKEILGDTEFEEQLILKDYLIRNKKTKFETILEEINNLTYEELMENKNIIKILGYDSFDNVSEIAVVSKGYRILNKIPKMPSIIIENLIKKFKNLNGIVDASIDDLDEVDGIGEVRAQNINQSLRKMKEQYLYIR